MVSTRFESAPCKSWKPVTRPVPSRLVVFKSRPPPLPPRPRGKVYVYAYETPGIACSDNRRNVKHEPSWRLKDENEVAPSVEANHSASFEDENGEVNRQTLSKLKRQAKRAGEGFTLLADVSPKALKGKSKGKQMFMKQRKRMDSYTSPALNGKIMDDGEEEASAMEDEMSAPSNTMVTLQAGDRPTFQYTQSSHYRNDLARARNNKNERIFPCLRSPPPEWRDKVEANYKLNRERELESARKWNSARARQIFNSARSESAPPPFLDKQVSSSGSTMEERQYAGSANGTRSEVPTAAFDARKHKRAPHRQHGVREGRGLFVTTPHSQNDFNPRPVGWSRAYAQLY